MINNVIGEKYLGLWSGNLRNGPGLSVTLDGIYYEGTFLQDVLTVSFQDNTYTFFRSLPVSRLRPLPRPRQCFADSSLITIYEL